MNNKISHKVWQRLISAVLSWRFFCERSVESAKQSLEEDLKHPHCHQINAFKMPDGSFIRNRYDSAHTFVRAMPSSDGWGPEMGSYASMDDVRESEPAAKWGYWHVHYSCRVFSSDSSARSFIDRWDVRGYCILGVAIGTQVAKDLDWNRREEFAEWLLNKPFRGDTPGFREFLEDLYGIDRTVELPDTGEVEVAFKGIVEELRGLPVVSRAY